MVAEAFQLLDGIPGHLRLVRKADIIGSAAPIAMSYDPIGAGNDASRISALGAKSYYYKIYAEHPVVYACVEIIVQAAAIDAPLYDKPDHSKVPALEAFFANVNPDQNIQQMLISVYRDLMIAGEAFIHKLRTGTKEGAFPGKALKVIKGTGDLVGLRRLIGSITTIVPDKVSGEALYVEQRSGTRRIRYDMDDVICFRLEHPDSYTKGFSPLEVLDLTLATDFQAMRSYERFFANGMSGNKIFSMLQGTPEQAERNKSWIMNTYTRAENHHKPMFLMGDIKVVGESKEQLDMPFVNGRQFAIDSICACYSVPRSKLFPDQKGGLGKAGHEVEDVTFRRDTVAPLQRIVVDVVNRQLLQKEFKLHDLFLEPPAIQIARFDLSDIAESATRTGWTGNEIRTKIYNIPPSDAEGMDRPLFLVRGVTLADEEAGIDENQTDEDAIDPENDTAPVTKKVTAKEPPLASALPPPSSPQNPVGKGGPHTASTPARRNTPITPQGMSGRGTVRSPSNPRQGVRKAELQPDEPLVWSAEESAIVQAFRRFCAGALSRTSFARLVAATIDAIFADEAQAAERYGLEPLSPLVIEQLTDQQLILVEGIVDQYLGTQLADAEAEAALAAIDLRLATVYITNLLAAQE